ncbi:AsmA family protein [Gymnodinialimonas ulvae]|uniref:AsmA family protein n=1 Tax=Gymnodinialimonas ulvae TaxID=3126504 RepID=UPI0030B20C05
MRLLFAILGSIAVLALMVLVVFLALPAERLARVALDRLTSETGREITIEAATRPTLWPDLMISVAGLEVANPDWAGPRPLLRAEAATLRVGWSSLFGGEGSVDRIELTGAALNLIRAEDGRMSWRNGETSLLPLVLRQAVMQDARIRYEDAGTGGGVDLRRVSARVDLDEGASGSAAFTASGVAQGEVMELSGTITQAARFFEGTEQPVRLDLVWGAGQAQFNGRAALSGGAEGSVEMEATDLAPVLALTGREMPEGVARLVGDRVAVSGTISTAEGGSLHLRDGVVGLGETRLNAAFDLVPGEQRPLLRGTITGGQIGLDTALGLSGLAPDGTWSRAPYDVSGLFALDADLTVRAEALSLGALDLQGLDLRVGLTRGRMVVDVARVELAEGQLAGQFVVNGRGGLSVGGDLLLANAQAAPLLQALLGTAPLAGRGSASIEFLGVGDDLFTLLDGLEGEGDLSLGQGRLEGVDLRGVALNARERAEATEFDRLLSEVRIRGGVVIGEELRLDALWGSLIGEGRVDLARREVALRLVPERWPPRELPVPVVISGPWDGLEIVPDAAALEARAAAAAAERARAAEVARILGGPLGAGAADDGAETAPDLEIETEE